MLHTMPPPEQAENAREQKDTVVPSMVEIRDDFTPYLVFLSQFHNNPHTEETFTAGLALAEGHLPLAALNESALRGGLIVKTVQRKITHLVPENLPAILVNIDGSLRLLLSVAEDGQAVVLQPGSGKPAHKITLDQVIAEHSGTIILVEPEYRYVSDGYLDVTQNKHWLWDAFKEQRGVYNQVIIATLITNILALVAPMYMMNVYDRVIPNLAVETLVVLSIGFLGVIAFDTLIRMLRSYFIDIAGKKIDIQASAQVFDHVLNMRAAARPQSAGSLAGTIREFESMREFFTSVSMTIISDLPFILLFVIVTYVIAGPIAFVSLAAVAATMFVCWVAQGPLRRHMAESTKDSMNKSAYLFEALHSINTIKSVGAEGWAKRRWQQLVAHASLNALETRFIASIPTTGATIIQGLATVVAVFVGFAMIGKGELSPGGLFAAIMLTNRATAPLGQLAGILTRLNQAKESYTALKKIMDAPVERQPQQRFLHRHNLSGDITFRDVSFTYPGQTLPVLNGLSFDIRAGEHVGIIGALGCGKSTVLKLILNMYQPDKGNVLIDHIEISQIDPLDLRRNVGSCLQDYQLFSGSIRDNIVVHAPHVSDKVVLRAAQAAGVDDWVRGSMAKGYDEYVGERGERLSGGQRQSLALARAMLLSPSIMIMDEPTSAMDKNYTSRIMPRVKKACAGKTMILVTHQMELLSLVDRLIVMDKGKVAVDGPRDRVLQYLSKRASGEAAKPVAPATVTNGNGDNV